jgi:hypothetical protein
MRMLAGFWLVMSLAGQRVCFWSDHCRDRFARTVGAPTSQETPVFRDPPPVPRDLGVFQFSATRLGLRAIAVLHEDVIRSSENRRLRQACSEWFLAA